MKEVLFRQNHRNIYQQFFILFCKSEFTLQKCDRVTLKIFTRNNETLILELLCTAAITRFFYLDFLSRTFTIYMTAVEVVGYLFYHFHLLDRRLDINRAITENSSSLHIASSWTRTRNYWFLSLSH